MPEIDDAQLAQYTNVDAFVRRGLANPKTRRKLLEVQKTLNPDTPIPEIDESDPLREELKTLRDDIVKDRDERTKKEQEREEQARLASLRTQWTAGQQFAKKHGYADEGLTKLEAFMEEHAIPSHEVAIPYFEKANPPPVPAVNSGSRWDFFGQQAPDGPDLKMLYEGHDEQWLDQTVRDTLNRVRSAA
jgi:hypothetical protein